MAEASHSKRAPIGKRFGRVTVCGPYRQAGNGSSAVAARCDCGDEREYFVGNLTRQGEPMCPSCRTATRPSKGHHRHPLFNIWKGIIQRCENPKHTHFASYGGRGIRMCGRWRQDFSAFASDMGERPSAAHTIDREDADGGYEPSNCRWAMPQTQGNNRRAKHHRFVEWKGETITTAEAARVGNYILDSRRGFG